MPHFALESNYAIIALRGFGEFSSPPVRYVFEQFLRSAEACNTTALFLCSSTFGFDEELHNLPRHVGTRRQLDVDNFNFVAGHIGTFGRPVFGLACGQVDDIDYRLLQHTDDIFATESCYFTLNESPHECVFVNVLAERCGMATAAHVAMNHKTLSAGSAAQLGLVRGVINAGEWATALHMHTAACADRVTACANRMTPAMPRAVQYGPVKPASRLVDHPRRRQQADQEPRRQSPFPSMFFQPPPQRTSVRAGPTQEGTSLAAHAWPTLIDGQAITTVMIRSLPPAVTLEMLMDALDSNGLKDKYDFAHIPSGGKPSVARSGNLGYGFVNFIEPSSAIECAAVFTGYAFFPTEDKACSVHPAVKQGKDANVAHIMRFTKLHPSRKPFVRVPQGEAMKEYDVSTDAGSDGCIWRGVSPESCYDSSDRGELTSDENSHRVLACQESTAANFGEYPPQVDRDGFTLPVLHPDTLDTLCLGRQNSDPSEDRTAMSTRISGLVLVRETL